MNRDARFSFTMPSDAAKNARTCEMKWRSSSVRDAQWTMSPAKSISSAVQKDAWLFLYISQICGYLMGNNTNRSALGSRRGSGIVR